MQTRGPLVTLPHTGAALAQNLRVKWSGTALTVAAATEEAIGTLEEAVILNDTKASVRLFGEVRKMVAAGAFAIGAKIYGAAGGLVDDVTGGGESEVGQALEAASAANSIVEVIVSRQLGVPA